MKPLHKIQHFLKLEAAGGIVLFIAALAALLVNNSSLSAWYEDFLELPFAVQLGNHFFGESLLFWINEGLMSIFFLLVGLELKREFVEGELAEINKIILPGMAALGGMAVPACIFLLFNVQDPMTAKGWAIPVATDIAFALGVLALFGKKVPLGLKLFLMTLAIFDDVGAIIIIALTHSKALSWGSIIAAACLILILFALNKCRVRKLTPYLLLGFLLWISVLESGVHATVAGVILACMIPTSKKPNSQYTPLHYLEKKLHPWVAYLVLPLFAFANAGLSLQGFTWSILLNPLVVGIIAGLFFGKQLGVLLFSWIMIQFKWAELPEKTSWLQLYGVALLCGIGFTMSLFLGTLAFENDSAIFLKEVRLGVLLGSILSGIAGAIILQMTFKKQGKGGSG